ncbi:HAD family hydrolase [Paenibacillus sp. N4]|uniref:HAD family hydrolase n=1 Tax=Paenibacillus vietnamensis TaxID=2590547 RepID=UPI001CD04B21|nr:HAD family hydrolase [Paenibacillus vietnamensis]MCA0753508.1 HAD family hydrolase [Paenibacillus vietnamensis]
MPELIINKIRYPVKGILFDKDGTLLDFIRLWGRWSESMQSHYENLLPGWKIGSLPELWGTIHDDTGRIIDYKRNGPLAMGSTGDLLAILALQGYRLGLPWGESMRLVRESKQLADKEMERVRPAFPLPGMIPFLKHCSDQGLSIGIVTADETPEAVKHMEWMGIRQYFKSIIGNDQVERGKPYPDMVEKACMELGLVPADVAVIGDTNSDMQMGNSAGVAVTIGILPSESGLAGECVLQDAKVTVSSYAQLKLEETLNES